MATEEKNKLRCFICMSIHHRLTVPFDKFDTRFHSVAGSLGPPQRRGRLQAAVVLVVHMDPVAAVAAAAAGRESSGSAVPSVGSGTAIKVVPVGVHQVHQVRQVVRVVGEVHQEAEEVEEGRMPRPSSAAETAAVQR